MREGRNRLNDRRSTEGKRRGCVCVCVERGRERGRGQITFLHFRKQYPEEINKKLALFKLFKFLLGTF